MDDYQDSGLLTRYAAHAASEFDDDGGQPANDDGGMQMIGRLLPYAAVAAVLTGVALWMVLA